VTALGWTSEETWSCSRWRQEIFLLSTLSRQVLGPTQISRRGYRGHFIRVYDGRRVKLTNSYLLPRLKMRRAVPPHPNMHSWLAQGQLRLCLYNRNNSKADARICEVGATLAALPECRKHGNCGNQYTYSLNKRDTI
jgi:hypothetical protein